MRVLVACEESQVVTKAFRERGHEAYSCDLLACSGGHPEWHIMHDAVEVAYTGLWDVMIAHPPCTFLSNAGHANKSRGPHIKEYRENMAESAIAFMTKLWTAPIAKVCLENPVGVANTQWKRPTQIIQPYYFGDNEMKTTCLWLRGLPRLNGIATVHHLRDRPRPLSTRIGADGKLKSERFCLTIDRNIPRKQRAKLKSKTFPCIAKAMAEQWG